MLALVFTKEDLAYLEGDDRSTMHFYRSLLHRCPPRNFKMCKKHQLGLTLFYFVVVMDMIDLRYSGADARFEIRNLCNRVSFTYDCIL